jgi:hypothetical protein
MKPGRRLPSSSKPPNPKKFTESGPGKDPEMDCNTANIFS